MFETRLYRLSALAGLLGAVVLVVNVLRRAGAVPTNGVTHAVAPAASVLALFAVTGLYLWQRGEVGRLGLVGYVLSTVGFAGAVSTEVVVHFVFAHLPTAQVDELLAGPTRSAFTVIGVVFSLGALLFGAAMARSGVLPRAAALTYLVGLTLFSWRTLLPEAVVTVDGLVSAAAIVWMSLALWRGTVEHSALLEERVPVRG
jgi:hypothetical protein